METGEGGRGQGCPQVHSFFDDHVDRRHLLVMGAGASGLVSTEGVSPVREYEPPDIDRLRPCEFIASRCHDLANLSMVLACYVAKTDRRLFLRNLNFLTMFRPLFTSPRRETSLFDF